LELQKAIEREEFENAARLRDMIRQLKKEEANNA
jgi:protein arginine kinase activator